MTSLSSYWRPRYWPAWGLVSWMRLSAALPLGLSLAVHRRYGRALYSLAPRKRHVVRRNLEVCFPEFTVAERERLVKRHFESFGMSLAECAFAWFASDNRLSDRFVVGGLKHVTAALALGRGAILYTGHFSSLEICGRPLKHILPLFACMFSHRSNPLLDEIQRRGRLRVAHESMPSDNVRSALRALKRGAAIWYAPDQAHPRGELVPFFGEPASTNVATSKLARVSGAPIVPFSYRRCDDDGRYELAFHEPLAALPTDDPVADTRLLVGRLEEFIRLAPEQYQWAHRRFKGRPADLLDVYRGASPHALPRQAPGPAGAPARVDIRGRVDQRRGRQGGSIA